MDSQQTKSNEVTLILLGTAGNGKSATGNSILRKQLFKTNASTSSHNADTTMERGIINDVHVSVVDGPGIETDKSPEEILTVSKLTIEKALKLCDYRFSALLIVLKYGARFTKQKSDFIKTVKGILGQNVIRDYGVCIMTHGDNFEADNEDENVSFKDWCQQQEGEIKNLLQECNNRCVLFNNRTNDEKLKASQVIQLISKVSKNVQYTEEDYKAANSDLQKRLIQAKAPTILKETREYIESKRREINNLKPNLKIAEEIKFYEKIGTDLDNKEKSLLSTYGEVDSIQQALVDIKVFKLEMDSRVKSLIVKNQTEEDTPKSCAQIIYLTAVVVP